MAKVAFTLKQNFALTLLIAFKMASIFLLFQLKEKSRFPPKKLYNIEHRSRLQLLAGKLTIVEHGQCDQKNRQMSRKVAQN